MEKHESAKLGTINARDEVINMNFHHCPVNIKKYIDRRLKHPIFFHIKICKTRKYHQHHTAVPQHGHEPVRYMIGLQGFYNCIIVFKVAPGRFSVGFVTLKTVVWRRHNLFRYENI